MIFLPVLKLMIIQIINPGHDHQISALYIVYIREEKKNHQIKFVEKPNSKINLCHKRFGHLNENDLKKRKSRNTVLGLKFPKENLST